jgi:hypothetical protein
MENDLTTDDHNFLQHESSYEVQGRMKVDGRSSRMSNYETDTSAAFGTPLERYGNLEVE